MHELDEYLEKKGAKYFVTLTVIFYVIGTAIFNIYLRKLGIAEFDLVKLRYMFVGFTFGIISMVPIMLFLGVKKIIQLKKSKKPTKREKILFWKRFEIVIWILILPWTVTYSWYVFPEVPAGFGGAKPVLARLIGQAEEIKGINELIAFETGVPVDKLAFELASEGSELAIGANVMILDQNSERVFLLLTKDLYLSSTSSLARNLIESGKKIGELEETKNFKVKPLIVSANKIEGVTLSLYEPPEVLTREDIKIAAATIAADPNDEKKNEIVQSFIVAKAPESASKVLAVVQKQIDKKPAPPVSKPSEEPLETDPDIPPVVTPPAEIESSQEEIENAFAEIFDTKFLDFRAQIFGQVSNLCGYERRKQKDPGARIEMVRSISSSFSEEFPAAWKELDEDNYLVEGQREDEFTCNLVHIFQGAENADMIIQRLNEKEVQEGPVFSEVRDSALNIFEKSSQVNTAADRKYVSQVLIRHFNQKARQENLYWNEPRYLYEGRDDENYFANIRTALTTANSWEELGVKLTEFQTALEESQAEPEEEIPPVEEVPPVEEDPEEEVVEPPVEPPVIEEDVPVEPAPEEEEPAVEPEPEVPPVVEELPVEPAPEEVPLVE
ncbi:hypothetical protein K9M41_00430 [Candidatus Gracilibacteria bacterium]|nr:hypothetical protein [Candidatus Gracilibacteria bacterium]